MQTREELNARRKRYRDRNKARINALGRAYHKRNKEKLKEIRKAPDRLWVQSRSKAKQRGLSWDISIPQYTHLMSLPCFYCGGSLPPLGCGLDRLDNNKGYQMDNVAPCCYSCNSLKGSLLTPAETLLFVTMLKGIRDSDSPWVESPNKKRKALE